MDGNDHSAMLCVVYITTYCQITAIIHDSTGLPRIHARNDTFGLVIPDSNGLPRILLAMTKHGTLRALFLSDVLLAHQNSNYTHRQIF
ncbi:hypothetical protein [Cysteiniphilum sp. 6C5]|uniref:hypothetical protein n=1 Tax=unclassified Cysteiniphilum TaxID=2610889 RepID=UPI003F83AACB